MRFVKALYSPLSFCIVIVAGLFLLSTDLPIETSPVHAAPMQTSVTFSNPTTIAPVDRPSNNAGTNPGLPSVYPSNIVVAGLTGTITKVTVTFALTTTFPDDADILLVGPTGAMSLVMSDAGGSGDITGVSFTFDQSAAAPIADGPTAPLPAGTYQPSNYVGFATPEPGGQDNFPAPAGGLMNYPLGFNVFNGTDPNGTWKLYVVDDQAIDTLSLPTGWTIDITTGAAVSQQHIVDFDGNGKTDYTVVRNTGGGPSGQITWFVALNGPGSTLGVQWGISSDFFVPVDYDGDSKTDFAVYRSGAAGAAAFYILQSATGTVRVDVFGQSGDDPSIVDDYDGDGKADVAVYRAGASAGQQSTWFYRGSLTPASINFVPWGVNGDFVAPGDYDGDGKADYVVQRNNGGGQARFWMLMTTAGATSIVFGTPTDVIVPGDYDGDGKTDIATFRSSGGQVNWYVRPSSTGVIPGGPTAVFGLSATDFPVQGDYDGDGKTDFAIWRPSATPGASAFWILNSATSTASGAPWGQNGDYPVANYNRH